MLFCVGATTRGELFSRLHCAAASRKRLKTGCSFMFAHLFGAPNGHQHAAGNHQHRQNTVNPLCFRPRLRKQIIIHVTLMCDGHQTLEIHIVLRRWSKSGCGSEPFWSPKWNRQQAPTPENLNVFGLGHNECVLSFVNSVMRAQRKTS